MFHRKGVKSSDQRQSLFFTFSHDLSRRLTGPVERMSVGIPLIYKGLQPFSQVFKALEIGYPKTHPLLNGCELSVMR